MSETFSYRIKSTAPEITRRTGSVLARQLPPDTLIALYGDLAAGKTTFTQGVCAALNADQPATSPTFTLINEYQGDLPIFHFDCYRIKHPDEILLLGFEEYLEAGGIVLIEWPEIIAAHLPEERIDIRLRYLGERSRDIQITAPFQLEGL
jgi:tRNA threonylcarbamoyladenosine biosynthesis protein TsaE